MLLYKTLLLNVIYLVLVTLVANQKNNNKIKN